MFFLQITFIRLARQLDTHRLTRETYMTCRLWHRQLGYPTWENFVCNGTVIYQMYQSLLYVCAVSNVSRLFVYNMDYTLNFIILLQNISDIYLQNVSKLFHLYVNLFLCFVFNRLGSKAGLIVLDTTYILYY